MPYCLTPEPTSSRRATARRETQKKMLNILTNQEIDEKLKKIPGWKYKDNKIVKEFVFGSFIDALIFINQLAPFCQRIDHHPDMHWSYKKIIFELTRYSVGGKVTDRDFIVASEIERLYKEYKKQLAK